MWYYKSRYAIISTNEIIFWIIFWNITAVLQFIEVMSSNSRNIRHTRDRTQYIQFSRLFDNISLVCEIRRIRRTGKFVQMETVITLFLFSYDQRRQTNLFFSPLRLMEMYGIVCLTTLLVTKTKAKGDPSRKTRKRVRRSTGLSILFPSFS